MGTLKFDHTEGFGKMTRGDFIHAPAYFHDASLVEAQKMAEQGWQVNEWETPRTLYQARQVRLEVPAECPLPLPPGVTFTVDDVWMIGDLEPVFKAYLSYKGFSAHLPAADTARLLDADFKSIIRFYHDGDLVAFTIVRHVPYFASLQFAWDYKTPSLRLGFVSQAVELALARSLKHRYVYIGPGYEKACLYKANLPGFQWWTGGEWSTDKVGYQRLCMRDDAIMSIQDASFSVPPSA